MNQPISVEPMTVEFDVRTDEMLVNMGPQHPSTHGVLRLVLRTDGEVISEVTPHLGYLHRCAEKVGENVTPIQFIPYTDRMDYLAGMNMNLGYSLAVEKLCGMVIPEKAQVIRVIISELNRIASHLVGMGAYGLDLGSFSPFLYAFREREQILDLFEEVCGARLTYSYLTIGGAHDDLPAGWLERVQKFIGSFRPRIAEYHALLTNNHIFVKRTAGIGVLSREMALSYGCTGPMLRASLDRTKGDPDWDLRKIEPYCGYETYEFDVPLPPFENAPSGTVIGDCWHRFYVRMLEVVQSLRIIEQAIDRYPKAAGSHRIEPPRTLTPGECYVETECPRGQMGFYVVGRPNKDAVPLRVRARSSSFSNLSVTSDLCRGCLIADIPAIIGSIDIVMGEIDR
ncbi:NADH-quinone oxidoreductase subunit D [Tuwongella immobilis]|uniref:NADH-quinone oxidoreductase subunit D n=1 Tax=Tuwongella immobilis TaxID=692036 RepID=A0A6C2YL00_9BACT|nr:NADH-quinone oxidoreductase subunit D [Tuwongella immobilis]VIP02054.1 nadh dehydrogenase subunit d : NADH-quinone oxidoreductase subunit D OS=uncultured planctomycete GN=nuoD PE=3 SV=1: Complex1_49kDa: Complex1_49kDa [Tuwongella immobilis]VTS00249.1 nadh dehydrogenase subunit d : NADH-quinone oxidoreductase subunit D OS=uncultured planctomycete GN=nuoD PE=3 SV=1: Complex1_49kDa: Complex1_49kDa [Tuwongella immobilis]